MSYRLLDHATDAVIEVEAPTIGDAFRVAGEAVVEVTLDRGSVAASETREFSAEGKDLRYLLFSWLEEVVYLLTPWAWLQSLRFRLGRGAGWPWLGERFQVNSLPMVGIATVVDFGQRLLTGRTSNIRVVGRKMR